MAETQSLLIRAQTLLMPTRGNSEPKAPSSSLSSLSPPSSPSIPAHFTWIILTGLEGSSEGATRPGAVLEEPFRRSLESLLALAPASRGVWVLTHGSCELFLTRLRALQAAPLIAPPEGASMGWPHPAWFLFDLAPTGKDTLGALEACTAGVDLCAKGHGHLIFEALAVPEDAPPKLAKRFTSLATLCDERDRLPPPAHFRMCVEPHHLASCQLLLAGDRCDDVAATLEACREAGLPLEISAPLR